MALETWILDGVKELDENEKGYFFIQFQSEKRTVTAGVLISLLFGWFGLQKFYLGDLKGGVLSILFSWTFIPFVLALIDATQMDKLIHDYNCFIAEQIIEDIKYLR